MNFVFEELFYGLDLEGLFKSFKKKFKKKFFKF